MAPIWPTRGLLRSGVVTTRYPRRADDYGATWPGEIEVVGSDSGDASLADVCPTGAIESSSRGVSVDRGRCILCGRCADARPDVFRFSWTVEVSTLARGALVAPDGDGDEANVREVREKLAGRVRAFRRSVHIRHVDCGSDGSDEWEIAALTNPVYDVHRLGIFFTASPRHADILLATGVGARGMRAPLERVYEAMPEPRVVIAAGTDAVGGGMIAPTYAALGGVGSVVPIDVWVPGSPPTPFGLLHGILLAIGAVPSR